MNLKKYFENYSGISILATSDLDGKVDVAIYSKPHVFEDNTLAFIMRDRLTHKNISSNPYAVYMFIEEGEGYKGIRIFLKKIREDNNPELINNMKRRHLSPEEDESLGPKFLVYFKIEKILNLIGGQEIDTTIN